MPRKPPFEYIVTVGILAEGSNSSLGRTARFFVRTGERHSDLHDATRLAGSVAKMAEEIRSGAPPFGHTHNKVDFGQYPDAAQRPPDYESMDIQAWFIDEDRKQGQSVNFAGL